jgi:uncharacterized protein YutE (UPF0331/DUF86 family)/predicted nucleotidyltransferase
MKRELCLVPRIFRRSDLAAHADALTRLFEEHGVELVLLFGSLARGSDEAGDLDLAVAGGPPRFDPSALYDSLCRLFGADNIDVVPLDRAPFLLRARAVMEGRVLFVRDPEHLVRMVEGVLFEHPDFRYWSDAVEQHLIVRLRGGLSVAERRLDRGRVTAYLSQLDVSVAKLAALKRGIESFPAFTADEDRRDLAVHHLRIALECVLDVCRHFLAVKGVSLQHLDSTNFIELAGSRGLLPAEFAQRIRGMAGVRNAIVHAYVNLDYRGIYDLLTSRLPEFDEFGRHVLQYLDREARGA